MTLEMVLTSVGHEVVMAADGEEALSKLTDFSFDMIISDIYMPNIDGARLRDMVRALPEKARLLFLFISGCEDQQAVVSDPVCEGFFKKGGPLNELLEWVRYLTTSPDKRPLSS